MSINRKASPDNEDQLQQKKIEDCRRLYLKYGGRWHMQIEREMRALGHTSFHRRILYSRFERGRHRPGWIELYGFNAGTPPAGNAGALACKAGSPGLRNLNNVVSGVTSASSGRRSGGHAGEGACAPGMSAATP